MLAARITLPHFSVSSATCFQNSAGAIGTGATATLTYVPGPDQIAETVCAENPHEYYNNRDADVPKAEKPDF